MSLHYHVYNSLGSAEEAVTYARVEDAEDLVRKWGEVAELLFGTKTWDPDGVHLSYIVTLPQGMQVRMGVRSCAKASCPPAIGRSPRE